jgi:hypothetical protein
MTFQRGRFWASKDPHRYQGNHQHYGRSALSSGRGSALGASEAYMALSSLQASAVLTSKYLPHVDFGQTMHRVQASQGEKHEGRAAAVSGANSWSMMCLHATDSHPPAVAEAAETEAPRDTQKN